MLWANRKPRWLIAGAMLCLATTVTVRAQRGEFDLLTASVADVQAAVKAGALTYERLVQLYLSRVEAYDEQGPKLNAVIEINPRAVEIARALDEERKTKGLRSPLHGIPVAVKDNIDVADIPSAGGNLALAGTYPAYDATVIRRLREAGAIIFLKTNMDELALGSQGLSSAGGQTLNPYDPKRHPGGSSGGTAVAVSAGFATIGLGTETGVSIRNPASNNALVGIAPTQGLVSRAGVIPVSFTQDRVGPHAKSVADAALLLEHIRGFDAEDMVTSESLGKIDRKSYDEYLDDRLVGARIGVLRDLFRKGKQFGDGNKLVDDQIALLAKQRAVVIDGLSTGMDLVSLMPQLRVNNYELRYAFDAYLRRRGSMSPVKTLAELVGTGKYLKRIEGQLQQALKRERLDFDPEYQARLDNRRMVRQLLIELMDRYGVDALVYPFPVHISTSDRRERWRRDRQPRERDHGPAGHCRSGGTQCRWDADCDRVSWPAVQRTEIDSSCVRLREGQPATGRSEIDSASVRRSVLVLVTSAVSLPIQFWRIATINAEPAELAEKAIR